MGSVQSFEHAGDPMARQYDRKPCWCSCLLDAVEPRQFNAQDVLVHEQQRALGLVLRGRCYMLLDRQMRKECLDLRRGHRVRVPLAMEKDEAFNPVDVGLFGAQAVMFEANAIANAIEEAGRGRMIHIESSLRRP